ncbi:hypothetical protein ACWDUX_30325 [Streptomyces sp. NPDC003444]
MSGLTEPTTEDPTISTTSDTEPTEDEHQGDKPAKAGGDDDQADDGDDHQDDEHAPENDAARVLIA